jgi:hypothetical protein
MLPSGISLFSTDIHNGFFGFLNKEANPAAFLHSIFPDLGGNFGIMIALCYFDPLIVSMVLLTEVRIDTHIMVHYFQLSLLLYSNDQVFCLNLATQCKYYCDEFCR